MWLGCIIRYTYSLVLKMWFESLVIVCAINFLLNTMVLPRSLLTLLLLSLFGTEYSTAGTRHVFSDLFSNDENLVVTNSLPEQTELSCLLWTYRPVQKCLWCVLDWSDSLQDTCFIFLKNPTFLSITFWDLHSYQES
jgi:hypothetical protein